MWPRSGRAARWGAEALPSVGVARIRSQIVSSGTWLSAWRALWLLLLVPVACGGSRDRAEAARSLLAEVAAAYRAAPALEDDATLHVLRRGRETVRGSVSYTLGAEASVQLQVGGLSVMAIGQRLYVTREGVDDRYLEGDYRGDLRQALVALLGADVAPRVPVPVTLRAGGDVEAMLDGWRYLGLGPLSLDGVIAAVEEEGRQLDGVRFEADNGTLEVRIDRQTRFVHELAIRVSMARTGQLLEGRVRFAPKIMAPAAPLSFDRAGRRAVASLAELEATPVPVGAPVPDLVLESLAGGQVALAEPRGTVVVIDLWASWCTPCWLNLPRLQRFAERSRAAGRAVEVFTINTAERFESPAARRAVIERGWSEHGLSLPVLLDAEDEAFQAFGSPALPSLFVIDRAGRVASHRAGLDLNLDRTLERELAGLETGREKQPGLPVASSPFDRTRK